ncbi:TlpA family protein disulfide reductase, partial [Candidatus Parcubacteria bacterium]
MAIQRKGWKILAILLLIGAYLVLQRLAATPKAPAIRSKAVAVREPFPVDFALPDLAGSTIRLSAMQGKVVLLNFWA